MNQNNNFISFVFFVKILKHDNKSKKGIENHFLLKYFPCISFLSITLTHIKT